MNEITQLRVKKNLSSRDMVEVVKPLYPKFDKITLSKCEHGDLYGIEIKSDALRELYRSFGQNLTIAKKKDNRRLNHHLTVRVDDTDFELLKQNQKKHGFDTLQDCLSALIKTYNSKSKRIFPDRPTIKQLELNGAPESIPVCPICGEECEEIFKDRNGSIVGCDICLHRTDASVETECFPDTRACL